MAKKIATPVTASKKTTVAPKATPKKAAAASKEPVNERGFAQVKGILPITPKNVKTAAAREISLRDFVLGALVANPDLNNEEVFALVTKAGRDNAQSTTEWYAARVRQGHIKAVK